MLYEQFRWINITDKNKLYEIFKTTFTYTGYELLKNFDSDSFIKNHNINELKNFTNEFILDIKDNFEQIIETIYYHIIKNGKCFLKINQKNICHIFIIC